MEHTKNPGELEIFYLLPMETTKPPGILWYRVCLWFSSDCQNTNMGSGKLAMGQPPSTKEEITQDG